ncbi:MAG: peptidoglycan bridge formation glycyltransferase FemA/FemB family protein [Erysipelotrichaceae bacterium]|nr:peptidoglycan bridge formation glycyltransferase FemA/FemB family protein [Erysipelotrichaceae bacterium]
MQIKEIKKEDFNGLARNFEMQSFHQTSNWADLKVMTGWKSLYLGYEDDNGQILALGLFLLKKMPVINSYLAYCPRGFMLDYNNSKLLKDFNRDLIACLKDKHVFELIIDPNVAYKQRDIGGNLVEGGFDNSQVVNDLLDLGYCHKNGFNLNFENLQPRFLFRTPLDKSYDEIFKGFGTTVKRRAKKKDALAVEVRELDKSEIHIFKELMEKTADRKGFVDRSFAYYEKMYNAMHDGGFMRLFVAEINFLKCKENLLETIKDKQEENALLEGKDTKKALNTIATNNSIIDSSNKLLATVNKSLDERGEIVPLSAICLMTCGIEAIQLLAGNDKDYLQEFSTSVIIIAEMIRKMKEEGYQYYNFYGISGNFDPKSEHYGLYSYKREYGGEVVELIGQFEYTVNKPIKMLYDILMKGYSFLKRIR